MPEMPVILRSRYHGWLLRNPEIYKAFLGTKISDTLNTDLKWVDPANVVTDFDTLLHMLDVIVHEPPEFYQAKRADGTIIGEPVAGPAYLVFNMLSNTSAAYDLFRMKEFNEALNHLLNCWGKYLHSPGSNSTLNTGGDGWFNPKVMEILTSGLGPLSFE
ncbi:Phophatidylserine decarboxylase-domain-containing protein [Pisolithus tinctorius]|uniref:L-tryptophan decarboxylase PsiD-like domain-containing protein n=1 Tax=Pisolithus tinctorius Marx 270 TaxID=870435 RepID=A0A0C3NYN2_PISTI|nr:Phophatidylserine decarboxylase-domain-containing protein [Pisolithus tinctorius]KIO00249.1 hypothetical protein M404DRAFT_10230 [Pisolithus tinctorius Marx 270]